MYLAVLGRQQEISLAELEAQYQKVHLIQKDLAVFDAPTQPNIARLGGSLKLAEKLTQSPLEFLSQLPEGKITIGVSDYSKDASHKSSTNEALKLKKILTRHNRSVRVVENRDATLSTASSLHNGLSGRNNRKIEFIKVNKDWYRVIGIQDIDAYAKRDQARPARDAKVGMLPPKLAQILINLCGNLPANSTILDPFCGTGVVLQEAILMGYYAYGSDINERMVNYSQKNLTWLLQLEKSSLKNHKLNQTISNAPEKEFFQVQVGNATNFVWQQPIDAIACESYLGQPMSTPPTDIKLKQQKEECKTIILGFLKNLASQISSGTPVIIATPAWLRPDGAYSRLGIVDNLEELGYNVNNKSREGLLYCRPGQIVARDIIILRKK